MLPASTISEALLPAEEVAALECKLLATWQFRIQALQVRFRLTGLVLQGRTDCYHNKQLIQQEILDNTSFRIEANEIEVIHSIVPNNSFSLPP